MNATRVTLAQATKVGPFPFGGSGRSPGVTLHAQQRLCPHTHVSHQAFFLSVLHLSHAPLSTQEDELAAIAEERAEVLHSFSAEAAFRRFSVPRSASPARQKQIVGERLYTLILEHHPSLAGKITGMLLEAMTVPDLVCLVNDPLDLRHRMQMAIDALARHNQMPPISLLPKHVEDVLIKDAERYSACYQCFNFTGMIACCDEQTTHHPVLSNGDTCNISFEKIRQQVHALNAQRPCFLAP